MLDWYEALVRRALMRPALTVGVLMGAFVLSLGIYPLLGVAFFPRTDAGQFMINLKAPTGTRIESTEQYVAKIEDLVKQVVNPTRFQDDGLEHRHRAGLLGAVHNQRWPYTATIQVAAQRSAHDRQLRLHGPRAARHRASSIPDLRTFFHSGSMVDAVLNMGSPAPIDVQVSGRDLDATLRRRAGSRRAAFARCRASARSTSRRT